MRSLTKGMLLKSTPLVIPKTVAFVPIPSARAITAIAVNPGFLPNVRSPNRTSSNKDIQLPFSPESVLFGTKSFYGVDMRRPQCRDVGRQHRRDGKDQRHSCVSDRV